MKTLLCPDNFSLRLLGLVLFVLLAGSTAWGLPIVQILTPTPGATIPEGGGPAIIDFRVKNNLPVDPNNPNANMLILDYAFASITPGPPDPDDLAFFSGNNGASGLVSGSLLIPAGGIGDYKYSFSSPADIPENLDFGVNQVFFAIEMSPLGNCTGPPTNTISSATPLVLWVDQRNCPNPADATALNSILNLQNPQNNAPPHNKLYGNGDIGTDAAGNPFGLSTVQVNDTPEPAGLFLMGWGLMSFVGLRLRAFHRRAK